MRELSKPNGKILLMDDDEAGRVLAAVILRKMGFIVAFAGDGCEALRLYREQLDIGQPFVAVILDLSIPGGLGGIETIKRLRELNPALVAFVTSGNPNDPAMVNFKEFGFSAAIEKPSRYEELQEALRKAITSG